MRSFRNRTVGMLEEEHRVRECEEGEREGGWKGKGEY